MLLPVVYSSLVDTIIYGHAPLPDLTRISHPNFESLVFAILDQRGFDRRSIDAICQLVVSRDPVD